MTDETAHIARAAAALNDPHAALNQHLHGDGDVPNCACATYNCDERAVARYERGGVGSYYCADCAEALDFPDVTGPHPPAAAPDLQVALRQTFARALAAEAEVGRLRAALAEMVACGFSEQWEVELGGPREGRLKSAMKAARAALKETSHD